ncbi:16S rRNA (guanine(966)-N(2))-methyltransferase RsmD [Litorisediminicola beolgyonensis]|uniref:16S rRNA (Guanine(966)-N(2))-methyltransferase RsmD n=1 Tax=Litorisediminicola beolgyonensis TaxID=1173614 RepID=A0ABW3ZEJ3_9RHOB
MRIVAGRYRGRPLTAVGKGDPKNHLRPTTDRVREALFNALAGGRYGDPLEAAHVLDLFAGTGALGFEALSRGAGAVTFVEQGRTGRRLIAENIRLLDCADEARLLPVDATRLPAATDPAQLVFLDPPYGQALGAAALASARRGGWIAKDALIVWEENAPQDAPAGFAALDHRRYGDTHVTVLRAE